ncbi:hypothetical protein PGT21_031882 [Puccinia graminis f. sp. tritici]|uniref:Uncharacterized protein n=1 Tax=Puccinia graminis f. sp. tritici TaxID=56615 RepID=A0A5B0Q7B4_PUCGR|nr:hypothetical protein PGT21_031882 [Puccinia graminis f. sp. tritici]
MSPRASVVDFAKYMMGCAGGNSTLPPEPTIEEVRSWERLNAPSHAVNALHKVQPSAIDYYQSGFLSHPNFSLDDKNRCDLEFRLKGFTRVTFEWRKPNFTDSAWNKATADIICDNWGIWVLNERKTSTVSSLGAKEVLQEWLVGRNIDLLRTRKEVERGQEVMDRDFEQNGNRHMLYRKKVSLMLSIPNYPDTVSDYEESQDITIPPSRIVPSWRSDLFTSLVRGIDCATVQLAAQEKKTAILLWLRRSGERRATQDEETYQKIPLGLHLDAYAEDFIEKTSVLEHHQLKIHNGDQVYTLQEAVEHLNKVTKKSSTTLYM